MSPTTDFDVFVIGGGSAGYAAANTAQEMGARVAIADPGPLGGLCILRGCMPSKAILRSSDVIALMRRASEFGLRPVDAQADLSAIIDRKHKLIREFADYRIEQLKNPRFTLYEDGASFVSPNEVRVGERTLKAKTFIIATGSIAGKYPVPGLIDGEYITSDEALELRKAPESMIVLGGGPVALELAQFYRRIGVRVAVVQRSVHIMSSGDEDLARPVEARLREEGMQVFTDTRLLRVEADGAGKRVFFTHAGEEKSVEGDVILQALGRRPNTERLNLEAAGVELSDNGGYIRVDPEMRTSQSHIFAVGDVNGLHEVVHTAIEQGEVAAHNAVSAQAARRMDDRLKTTVVFTDPAVASVGLTEKECRAQNIPYLTASYPFNDHGKSLCLGEPHGHVKLLCDPETGEIIGGHIVGPEAGELIHSIIATMYFRGTVGDLLKIPHYHPTLSEILTYPAEELAEKLPQAK